MRRFSALFLSIALLLCVCGCKRMSETSSDLSFSSDAPPSSQAEATQSDVPDNASQETNPSQTASNNSSSKKPTSSEPKKQLAPPVSQVADPQKTEPGVVDSSAPSVQVTPQVIEPRGDKLMAYSRLNDKQKNIYSLMSTAIDSHNDQNIKMTNKATMSDVTVAFRAVTFDRPEVFWLSSNYSMASDGSFFKLNYTCTKAQKASMLTALKQQTNRIENEVAGVSSRYEKVHRLHDWLCENVRYSTNHTDELAYTAYGAIMNGSAVCEGYSRAMQLFCDELGIPCYLIYGTSRGVAHMWNAVELEAHWYQLDVTWDDDETNGFVRHSYLDITESSMLADHSESPLFSASKQYSGEDSFNFFMETCDTTKLNYFVQNNLYLTDDYPAVAAAIANSPSASKRYCELYVQNSLLLQNFEGNIANVLGELNTYLQPHGITITRYSVTKDSILISWG